MQPDIEGAGDDRRRDQNATGELAKFFSSLTDATQAAEAELQQRLEAFFSSLKPPWDEAQATQAELDRKLATKWSVFTDFRPNENALSRIFRTLLDPAGTHGQGTLFLDKLLEEICEHHREVLGERDHLPGTEEQKPWPHAHPGCTAHTEYRTDDGGRIDIVVQWPGNRAYWMGIENKPRAAEQERQIERYFNALRRKTEDDISRVLVLYFSGTGTKPETTQGLSLDEQERCVTLPYRTTPDRPSVEGWVHRCAAVCEAKRIHWFLAEIERYIQTSFEPKEVQMGLTHETIIQFVQENENWELAEAVAEAVRLRKEKIGELVFQAVKNLLGQEFPHSGSDWVLVEKERRNDKRLILQRNKVNHPSWKSDGYHGVWFLWADDNHWYGSVGPFVGVEWPRPAASLTDLRKEFLDVPQGGQTEDNEWFSGCPDGPEWIGWNHLLPKTDDEIKEMAEKTVELMKKLAEIIDWRYPARQKAN